MSGINEIKVGSTVIALVGCSECKATVKAITEKGYLLVSAKSGKEFTSKRIKEVIAEPEPVQDTSAAALVIEVPEPTEPETEIEDNTPNPAPESGKPEHPEKKDVPDGCGSRSPHGIRYSNEHERDGQSHHRKRLLDSN